MEGPCEYSDLLLNNNLLWENEQKNCKPAFTKVSKKYKHYKIKSNLIFKQPLRANTCLKPAKFHEFANFERVITH